MRGAVLAGGSARRFAGRPKGLEDVGGKRILDRVAETVRVATGEPPLLIADPAESAAWRSGLDVAADEMPGCGSLGGIYTALVVAGAPVVVVAWDMPFVPPALLCALIEESDGYDVFLPESNGPQTVEPLCGVYNVACIDPIRRRLEANDLRATGFHDVVRAGTLPLRDVARYGDPDITFLNVNTPADLKRARSLWHATRQ